MLLAVTAFLPVTLPMDKQSTGSMLARYLYFWFLIRNRVFLGIVVLQAFISMSMFAYIAGSSFVWQNVYETSAQQFFYIFALNRIV